LVHIKKLEVYGFKSFGFKNTVVHFDPGLVAVTGPNGSGKSNILDAIMFAIGENSPKAMRVDKFSSLFHDSGASGHRLIRVSVTFDNADRGIPMDEDSVTLTREMEGQSGESQYLLNGKKVSKAAIMELLEVVLSAPNKLNIVQQGMITRISELNSEERRKIIEDIVGLSYFDEKKAESLKQLDEADRRLEVAFARMGEIRKRIEELEVERNDQLRYEQISSELKRFRAVQISNNIRTVKNKLATTIQILETNMGRSVQLTKQIDELRAEIEVLETDKSRFMQEVDAANKAKAQLASRTAAVVHDSERTKAMLNESQRRISEIERRLPSIAGNRHAVSSRMEQARSEIQKLKISVDQKKAELSGHRSRLDEINTQIEQITATLSKYAGFRRRLEERSRRINGLKSRIELEAARIEEKIKTSTYKKDASQQALAALDSEMDAARDRLAVIQQAVESERQRLADLTSTLESLRDTKANLERELEGSAGLIAKAESMATKFEERASVAKNAMADDMAIAELMKDKDRFGIKGLVHDLMRWDKEYERPVLAAGSEWMKAFVVEDVKSMIAVATYAKERKLPRLRIIPLDVVSRFKPRPIKEIEHDVNVVGTLDGFVYSDYDRLPAFLFSDTVLVRNSSSAYMLARQGYRAVSVEGELFGPAGGSMSLDFGSRISDLTKAILLGNSVEGLRETLGRLSRMVEKKNSELKGVLDKISSFESERIRLGLEISSHESNMASEAAFISSKEKSASDLAAGMQGLEKEGEVLQSDLQRLKRRLELLGPAVSRITARLQSIDESKARSEHAEKNVARNQVLKQVDAANMELNQLTTSQNGKESRLEFDLRQISDMDDESSRLTLELEQRRKQVSEMQSKSESLEAELKSLRDQEQQIIDSSGNAYSVLQDYERKIKALSENERRLSKENNIIERESALLKKDQADLSAHELRLTNDLVWLGYKNPLEPMDVESAIKELSDEHEQVKSRINLRADESYVQVIEGYRSMSDRRNQLENERNSIVSFIENIVKEKNEMFMGAFQRVDGDIRDTFSKLTGGAAWLEIENPEDVFAGGIMLLVQFPGKVGRESTALSGGEKTIAATVFLLALQSLKPSPFYLMDEVDAHLDAQNTERLSKILVERSKASQIIMVTLKDSTVAKASLIYGVYPRQGVSQVVKYRNPSQVPLAQLGAEGS
jgi:chromosome segregation protein